MTDPAPTPAPSAPSAPLPLPARAAPTVTNDDSPLRSVLSTLATVGVPITVVSALMLYFGWARTDQQARYMGLDVSLFGYSTQDYILRSISTLFVPLLAIGVLGLGWLGLHQGVRGWLDRPARCGPLRAIGRIAVVAGLVMAGGALLAVIVNRVAAPLLAPLALAAGAALTAYGLWLVRTATGGDRPAVPAWQRALRMLFVAGIIALALFWELSNYAGVVGRGYALQLAGTVPSLPRATAFSSAPLGIQAPGVREERLDGEPARYRTTGLRLLVRSGGRFFLLHDGWTPQHGTVIVLSDSDAVSWQFSR